MIVRGARHVGSIAIASRRSGQALLDRGRSAPSSAAAPESAPASGFGSRSVARAWPSA